MNAIKDHVQEDQPPEHHQPAGETETEQVRIDSLVAGDSPRIDGEVSQHIELLAAIDGPLPPILVHRSTRRVIDGMHRLQAAQLRGQQTIEVRFFDGTEEEAFVSAVKANTEHGLPLTRVDREAAAARIVTSHPRCSDRWLAAITGLAASTVAVIRRRAIPDDHRDIARIGRDGRVRPINSAEARRVASDVIARNPQASLREVAKIAGISPTTVRDVRERMRRGDDPIPPRELLGRGRPKPPGTPAPRPGRRPLPASAPRDRDSLLQQLRKDPSVRFTDSGRALLRWLELTAGDTSLRRDLIDAAPPHCLYIIAELARRCGQAWLDLAEELESQAQSQNVAPQQAAP
jgi:ParB/Sulfiredoxin domain